MAHVPNDVASEVEAEAERGDTAAPSTGELADSANTGELPKMRLQLIDPEQLGNDAHDLVLDRAKQLAETVGYAVLGEDHATRAQEVADAVAKLEGGEALAGKVLALGAQATLGPFSETRRVVAMLAHFAKTGSPPEGRLDLVQEYLISMIPTGLVPDDLDPDDDAGAAANETERAVHLVILGVLARERLANRQPVPTAWLAVLGSVAPSYVRRLVTSGELRRWRAGEATASKRVFVHPDDAKRWLEGRAR